MTVNTGLFSALTAICAIGAGLVYLVSFNATLAVISFIGSFGVIIATEMALVGICFIRELTEEADYWI